MKNKETNIIDCAQLNLKAQGVCFQENSNTDYCTPETFKRGDAVCFKSHPNIRIGTISTDFGDNVHVFTSDDYFKEFAPYGGPNTLTVQKDSIQLFVQPNADDQSSLQVVEQEEDVQDFIHRWTKFIIDDKTSYPPRKGNYIVSLHFPEDFGIEDYTKESNWAEYTDGEFNWSPQFESKYVTAWADLPDPFKN